MSGVMIAMGGCYVCKRLFSFNPNRVPSLVTAMGREPVCRECIERANPERVKRGIPPIPILPGAYEAEGAA